MSDMKCPFCQQGLEMVLQLAGAGGLVEEAYLLCSKCNIRGERKLWQELKDLSDKIGKLEPELERTRKALDVAKYALKNIKDDMKKVKDGDDIWEIQKNLHDYCKTTIKQITTLEQKDVK